MDAVRFPAGHLQISGCLGAAAEHHGVKFPQKLLGGYIHAHVGIAPELHALGGHQVNAPGDDLLIQLHIRNAEHHQAAGSGLPLKHSDAVAPVVQLVGGSQSRGAGADDRHPLAAAHCGDPGLHPAVGKAFFDDGQLVVVHRHTVAVQAAGAGGFAERRAHPARELREIVGLRQTGQRLPPVAVPDLVVPLRDQVVQGAAAEHAAEIGAGLAEGHAAVHAAARLADALLLIQGRMKLRKIADALHRLHAGIHTAFKFQKSCRFSHFAHLLMPG